MSISSPRIHDIHPKTGRTIFNLQKDPFKAVSNGSKILEGRIGKYYESIKVGDILVFHSDGRLCQKTVLDVAIYRSLEKYLSDGRRKLAAPRINTYNQVLQGYQKFIPLFNQPKTIEELGIYAFTLGPVKEI